MKELFTIYTGLMFLAGSITSAISDILFPNYDKWFGLAFVFTYGLLFVLSLNAWEPKK